MFGKQSDFCKWQLFIFFTKKSFTGSLKDQKISRSAVRYLQPFLMIVIKYYLLYLLRFSIFFQSFGRCATLEKRPTSTSTTFVFSRRFSEKDRPSLCLLFFFAIYIAWSVAGFAFIKLWVHATQLYFNPPKMQLTYLKQCIKELCFVLCVSLQ